jgi:hypothetical protein
MADDWAGFCHHVESQEKLYWEKDVIVPDEIICRMILMVRMTQTVLVVGSSSGDSG